VDYASLGVLGLFASAFISSTLAPGGSEVVLAYLLGQAHTPAAVLLTVATLGNTLGALTTWWLGFWASRRYPLENLQGDKHYKAVQSVRRYGLPLLLLSWLPVVGDGFCFAAGWLRLSFTASLLAIALGKLSRYAAIVYWLS
jgi:membrane protein YqaA with SNARE-associated domain